MANTLKHIRAAAIAASISWAIPSALAENAKNNKSYLFKNGAIITMDEKSTIAEAAGVVDNVIIAVGSHYDVKRALASQSAQQPEEIDLDGGALLPGFIEPHAHVLGIMEYALLKKQVVSPCLPERYEPRRTFKPGQTVRTEQPCPLFIKDALTIMQANQTNLINGWNLGLGLDPSRMNWTESVPSSAFRDNPAKFLQQYVTDPEKKDTEQSPVFIQDQSGHLAYANLQAFVAIKACASITECKQPAQIPEQFQFNSGGEWVTDENGYFTGLIKEMEAMAPFLSAVFNVQSAPPVHKSSGYVLTINQNEISSKLDSIMKDVARTGVTTIVNGGSMSEEEAELVKRLAENNLQNPYMRYRDLLSVDYANSLVKNNAMPSPNNWNKTFYGLYSQGGVKLWADGSTQGCTASLVTAYNSNGFCHDAENHGKGHKNYASPQTMVDALEPFWSNGWYLNIHANGDQAIKDSIEAMATMNNRKINSGPHTLIHATVGGDPANGESMVQKIADLRQGLGRNKPLNLHTSHLAGHIAYWGAALEGMLDGPQTGINQMGRASMLDPAHTEHDLNIPFSLHSDAPISTVNPLWYVEQMVTRNTWRYPNLSDNDTITMPGTQNISTEQALRAITIVPARQHRIDHKLGSIEPNKIADLVILNQNPLLVAPNDIHKIKVRETFVNGYRNNWSAPDQ